MTTRILTELDARILGALSIDRERSPAKVAELAGVAEDVALSTLRRLRTRGLVEDDGCRPARYLRTIEGARVATQLETGSPEAAA